MIGRTISHYKILEKLGEGGMGIVYKAHDEKLDRDVALKFLPPDLTRDSEARERFIHEAKTASALDHPNICNIHEIGETDDGNSFIVMGYYEGETLKKKIERGPLNVEESINITIQIARGLSRAHEAGVVHRDIKPANIIVTNYGEVKILDFGLAKLLGQYRMTKTSTTLGTVAYMSPEQTRGDEVDHTTDIWSLGIVLYEMLTGNLPFRGNYEQAVIYSILNEEPVPMEHYRSDVPNELQKIVHQALTKNKNTRYQGIDYFLADLKETSLDADTPIRGKNRTKRIVSISLIFLVVVLLFFVFKPWQTLLRRSLKEPITENRLAIMYFDNLTDPTDSMRLGEIATNLLITGLSQSKYIQVISSQRLYDILKSLGHEGQKKIDPTIAGQIAERSKAKWMLLGSILETKPRLIVTTQLIDVKSGHIKASQRIMGEEKIDVFTLVDSLTARIRNDLSLPSVGQEEIILRLADVTTHSEDAYRYYLEGINCLYKYDYAGAETCFEKALEVDSTFAMAYYRLTLSKWFSSGFQEKKLMVELIGGAVKYSGKVSQKEKYYIESMEAIVLGINGQDTLELKKLVEQYPDEKEAFYILGILYRSYQKYSASVRCFNKAIEIDSLYNDIYNYLAYTYNDIGDFEKSIWAINKYISLVPDEPNPYDSRGELYAWNGKIDKAIESYKKALEIEPEYSLSLPSLGHLYLFKGEFAKAESCYKKLCSSSDKATRSEGRIYLASIPTYQGKFKDALVVLDNGIGADKMERNEKGEARKRLLKAKIYLERGESESALKEIMTIMNASSTSDPGSSLYWRYWHVLILMENGEIERAEERLKALKDTINLQRPGWMRIYWTALGKLELIKGDFESSINNLEKAADFLPNFDSKYELANAYLQAGRLGESANLFERILLRYDNVRAGNIISAVKSYYLLGLAYEKSGWTKEAIENYEVYLDARKNGDPENTEVEDAKARLRKLRERI